MNHQEPNTPVQFTRYCYWRFTNGKIPENNPREVFNLIYHTINTNENLTNLNKKNITPYHFILDTNEEMVQFNEHLLTRPGFKTNRSNGYKQGIGIIGMEVAKTHNKPSKIENLVVEILKSKGWKEVLFKSKPSIIYIQGNNLKGFETFEEIERNATTTHITKVIKTYAERSAIYASLNPENRTNNSIRGLFEL